ncbi:MAG TPA: hypothetical protein VNN55_03980 [bacterium]|nr:hypothetical protein [bacterium]
MLANARVRLSGALCMPLLWQSDWRKYGVPPRDTEGLVDYSLSIKTARVGALLKELDTPLTRISLGSSDSIDVAKLARQSGGAATGTPLDFSPRHRWMTRRGFSKNRSSMPDLIYASSPFTRPS